MGVLIDTTVLIDLERRRKEGYEVPAGGEYFISVVTASELLEGVERGDPEQRIWRRLFAEEIFDVTDPLPITLPIARIRASVAAVLAAKGEKIGSEDLWIAATAVAHDLELVTRNTRGFSRVPGLRLVAA